MGGAALAQYFEFADYGNGTNSIGNLAPYDTNCKSPATGQIISCLGHGYSGPGPFKVRFFILGYGAALGEFDSTWEYDPNSQGPGWVANYTPFNQRRGLLFGSGNTERRDAPASPGAKPRQETNDRAQQLRQHVQDTGTVNDQSGARYKEYYPRPHLSTQYFTATVNIIPAQVPYRLDIYISNGPAPLSVANPISTFALALGAGLEQATQTSPQAWCFGQPTYVPVVRTTSSVVSRSFGAMSQIRPGGGDRAVRRTLIRSRPVRAAAIKGHDRVLQGPPAAPQARLSSPSTVGLPTLAPVLAADNRITICRRPPATQP